MNFDVQCYHVGSIARPTLQNQDCLLIDLREDNEIKKQNSINGAVQISYNKLPNYLHKKRKKFSKTKLVFYCAIGERSALAVQLCKSYNLQNVNSLYIFHIYVTT